MKVLFIIKNFIIEPLGIMYLSSALKKAGHEVRILKTVYKNYEKHALSDLKDFPKEVVAYEDNVVDLVKKIAPDIVSYSVTTGMHNYYLRINRKIKEKVNVFSIFGGPHPSFFPEIIEKRGVDAICRGEGEKAFVEFVNNFKNKNKLKKIKNFWVKFNSKIYKNDLRSLMANLDLLPFPDRELIYEYESSKNNPIKNFICVRGCPYDCTYCFNHAFDKLYANKGKRVRFRSPENVLNEIKEVKKKYPLKIVYFQDDTFVLSSKWLDEFLSKYKKEIFLPFHCHIRPNQVNEEIIKKLKDAGCHSATLALESADNYLRNNLLNRNMTLDQIYNSCRLLRKYKIKFRTENMIGLPTGSLRTALKTLFMNIRCKPDIGWASLYQPYPKTKLGEYCKEKRLFENDLDLINPSFFEKSTIKIKNKKAIENLQKLFSIIVEFPFLLPLALVLIFLPSNRFYDYIYKQWKEYCYQKRLYNLR